MPSIQSLVTPSVRTWVTGETYTPQKQNQDDRNLKRGVEELNSAIADVEDHYASGTQPLAKVQGKVWYDGTNSVLKLYHTANGTPVAALDSQKAYSQSIATGGTATFKLGGTIDVNTTQVFSGGSSDLMTSTLPANTISQGVLLIHSGFGTDIGAGSQIGLRVGTLGAPITFGIPSAGLTDWFAKTFTVGSGTQFKSFGFHKTNSDASGQTEGVKSAALFGDSTTSNPTTGFRLANGNDATQEMMVTRLAH